MDADDYPVKPFAFAEQISNYPGQLLDITMGQSHLHLNLRDDKNNILPSSTGWKASANLLENPVPADETARDLYIDALLATAPSCSCS